MKRLLWSQILEARVGVDRDGYGLEGWEGEGCWNLRQFSPMVLGFFVN
jgi:hypothetical protein